MAIIYDFFTDTSIQKALYREGWILVGWVTRLIETWAYWLPETAPRFVYFAFTDDREMLDVNPFYRCSRQKAIECFDKQGVFDHVFRTAAWEAVEAKEDIRYRFFSTTKNTGEKKGGASMSGIIYQFPSGEIISPREMLKGLFIIKPREPWPQGVEDYRDSLEIPGYYLLGWRMHYWGRLNDIATWETFWLSTEGKREFLHGNTEHPEARHAFMCETYPGYTPGSKIGRERAIERFYREDTEYGVICRPDLLLEKKDFRSKLKLDKMHNLYDNIV
jgi:hypothetical protein